MSDNGSEHRPPLQRNPLWISAGIAVGVLLLTHILQLLSQKELYFIHRLFLGYDLKYAWDAAVRMSQGTSPYVYEDYSWPTLFPWVLWKCGLLSVKFEAFARVMFVVTLGCLLLSLHLANRLFADPGEKGSDNIAPLLLIVGSSFPVYFLLDRCNLDGVTLVFMWAGLWLGFRGRLPWHEVAGGLVLAVAIGIKLFPIVLLLPLVIFRRFRIVAGAALGVLLIVALDPQGWRQFLTERLGRRLGTEWCGLFNENASLEAFFLIVLQGARALGVQISNLVATQLARGTAALAFAIAVGSTILLRRERDRRVQLAWVYSFVAIALAAPYASLAYVLVNVLPLALSSRFLLARWSGSTTARAALLLVFVGIGLGQFQAVGLAKLFQNPGKEPGPVYDCLSAFCSVGTFATLLGQAVFQATVAWSELKTRRRPRSTVLD